ncbi:MAG: SPASM domain-containing protein [Bacteriovoracaceae bacterium]|nr:SPASM domain-containing protein [Bacteriovoracaceae bacterium]
MKDLYLNSYSEVTAYKRLARPQFMKNELVFIDFNPSLTKAEVEEAFQLYSKDCDNLILKKTTDDQFQYLNPYIKGTLKKIYSTEDLQGKSQYLEIFLNSDNIDSFLNSGESDFQECLFLFLNPGQLAFQDIEKVKNLINHLVALNQKVNFSHGHRLHYQWDAKVLNPSRGPLQVDIDLSNGCTHNCQFCGLYADSVIHRQKSQNKGQLPPEVIAIQKAKIPKEEALEMIDNLPPSIERITFGGAGDPYTHGHIHEIISHVRNKGISVKTFTNFAYISKKDIEELHHLSSDDKESLAFIINLSGATAETYIKTRPNQTKESFEKITSLIRYASDLIKRDGKGFYMTLMCVTTKDNYHEIPHLVALSKSLGCQRLWIKPMELHDEESFRLLIPEESSLDYILKARLTLHMADLLNVEIFEREILQRIVENNSELIDEHEKSNPIEKQVKELASSHPETFECLTGSVKSIKSYRVIYDNIFETAPYNESPIKVDDILIRKNMDLWEEKIDSDNSKEFSTNSNLPTEVYDSQPCYIGYNYMRVQVDGKITPCCNLNLEIGDINRSNLDSVWNGERMAKFRDKMLKINESKCHHTEKLYSVCHQCPHLYSNRLFHQLRNKN